MLDVKEVESHIPNPYLSNILQVQREGWGKSSMYKLKSSQQIYSIQASQNEGLVGKSLRVSLPFFWFRPALRVFPKPWKVLIALLRRLNIRLVI